MTSIELRTRAVFDTLCPAERKVAAYFLSHVDNVFHMPIASLAEAAGVSQVAWVRFSKTLGFYGLKDLKKQLFSELNAQSDPRHAAQEPLYADISGNSTVQEMAENVKSGGIQAIEDTIRLLDPNVISEVAGKIIRANSVKLFGVGASALVAEDLYHKLLRIGMNVVHSLDFHVQLTYAANLTPRDVAIFFSHTGATSDVVEAMKIAKNCGATLVSVTQFGKRPIVSMADYALYTSCPEVYRRSGAMSSRIAQLTLVDVLYTAVAHLDYHRAKVRLENSYNSCKPHHLNE
ncbi:MAG: MurR/RpiR family transcriptional regulator [Clostridiales bacterium]|nr:MurR/RpiR family transcriptional regulator [Clostridiales bacterium]